MKCHLLVFPILYIHISFYKKLTTKRIQPNESVKESQIVVENENMEYLIIIIVWVGRCKEKNRILVQTYC